MTGFGFVPLRKTETVRILIIGATGMIGHKLWQKLSKRFPNVYALIHRHKGIFANTGLFDSERVIDSVDAEDFNFLDGVLSGIQPKVILNCTGITKRNPESKNPTRCITLNSLLPHKLAEWGGKHGARIFQFSTDCIFDGKKGNYVEESRPSAEDLYGRTKFLGELHGANCLTLRTSFVGRELTCFTELLEWFLSQRGKKIKGFRNALYTGVSTLFLSRVAGDLIEFHPHLSGLYHLAGQTISKYDLLCLARDAFGADVEIIPDDTFFCDRRLIGDRFVTATRIQIPSWVEMMHEIASDDEVYR